MDSIKIRNMNKLIIFSILVLIISILAYFRYKEHRLQEMMLDEIVRREREPRYDFIGAEVGPIMKGQNNIAIGDTCLNCESDLPPYYWEMQNQDRNCTEDSRFYHVFDKNGSRLSIPKYNHPLLETLRSKP